MECTILLRRVEQAEEVVSTKLVATESRIVELEEKLSESLNNEKSIRLQLTDVEYSEVSRIQGVKWKHE